MNPRRREILKLTAAAMAGGIFVWLTTKLQISGLWGLPEEESDGVYYVNPREGIDGIQAVIDKHAPNVSIRLGSGDYVGKELTLDHGVQLIGNGRNATRLILEDGANTDLVVTPEPNQRNCMQVLFRDITFDGNRDHNSSGMIVYGAFWNSRFVDCDFVEAPRDGFWLAGSWGASTDDNYFRGCRFIRAARDGLRLGLNREAGPAIGVTRLESCWFGSNGSRGATIRGNGNIISNGKFYANQDADVQIDRGDRNQVLQSDLSKVDPTGPCIEVIADKGVDSTSNQISGNVIFGSFEDAVYCNASGNDIVALQIHNNTIIGRDSGSEQNRSGIFAEGESFVACSARDNTFTGQFTASALRLPPSWETSGNIIE